MPIICLVLYIKQSVITKKAIELNTKIETIYANLGNAYYKLGNYQQAVKNYSKGIAMLPL